MVKLTIDQALQQSVEAHKAGKIQEADRLYTAILNAQPKHPDANHNMGALAVGVGKVEQAIPFFKTALEANPSKAQFWLSYIDALIKLERLADAKSVLEQAKSMGAKGDDFDRQEHRLSEAEYVSLGTAKAVNEDNQAQPNILEIFQLDQAMDLAQKKTGGGSVEDVKRIHQSIEQELPKNKIPSGRLKILVEGPADTAFNVQDPPQDQLQPLIDLYKRRQLKQALEKVKILLQKFPKSAILYNIQGVVLKGLGQLSLSIVSYNQSLAIKPDFAKAYNNMGNALKEQGKLNEAMEAFNKVLEIEPEYAEVYNNIGNVLNEKGTLEEAIEAYTKAIIIKPGYADAYYNMGVTLKEQGKLEEAIEAFNKALTIKPDYADAYNNMGNSLKNQGKPEAALEAYNKALSIQPNYAEAYYNIGVTLKEQGNLNEAIKAYNKALIIKPDYADAYNNIGITLKEQDKLEEAIHAFNKALIIKPDYADVWVNMGVTHKEQGKLEKAIDSYNKAVAIKPDYIEAIENSLGLAVQLLPIIANYKYDFKNNDTNKKSEFDLSPKCLVLRTIKAYLEANFQQANSHNKIFTAFDQKLLMGLNQKDKIFCKAYSSFIGKLLEAKRDNSPASETENKVYHLGESHCLSYAHQSISINGDNFKINPRITFGAKAFHFYRTRKDSFKAITNAHFVSLPENSKVLISYGEIDCRPNEGFITAARKLKKPLEDIITETVMGYVRWFAEQNASKNHHLYFIGVPAPVYNTKHGDDLNSEVARTVALFNTALQKYSLQRGFEMVDVFKFTSGDQGFSNGLFHVDNSHLGAKALPKIEQQLS